MKQTRRFRRTVSAATVSVALLAGLVAAALAGLALGVAVALLLALTSPLVPRLAAADWHGFMAWWRLQTHPLGKGTALASLSAIWPGLRHFLRPDYVWVTYPGTEQHKRAYMPPWVERLLRPVFPTGFMRFGAYWGMMVSSLATADSLETSPARLRALLDEIRGQFPGVPVALAGRLPSIAASTGVGLSPPLTHGDRGTVCAMAAAAREAASLLGREPAKVNIAVVGSKGFIGSRLVSTLSTEFGTVIALDSRYEEISEGEHGVLFTNRPEDLSSADVVFVLTPRGTDMDSLAPHIAPGTIVADDTHPEMPESLRARIEERGATVLKATLGDERFRFVPPIPDFRADDIPGCLLEALVIVQRGTEVLESQDAFNRAAHELDFRARLAPHRTRAAPPTRPIASTGVTRRAALTGSAPAH
jgi:hypothetical protein